MTRLLGLLAALVVALVAVQAAAAKEGANLTSYPTSGSQAGSTWVAEFEAFSHDGNALAPAVVIRNDAGRTRRFAARRIGSGDGEYMTGRYRAVVRFPAAGSWTYGVELRLGGPVQWFDDSPVAIAPAVRGSSPDGGGFELPIWIVALFGALLLGAAGGFAARRHVRAWVTTALR